MKKSEFKSLIKEALKEALLEDGVISGIIKESIRGAITAATITSPAREERKIVEEKHPDGLIERKKQAPDRSKLNEIKKRLLDVINKDAYGGVDLFEGTTPLPDSPSTPEGQAANPMKGLAPHDPGVDLSVFGRAFGKKD